MLLGNVENPQCRGFGSLAQWDMERLVKSPLGRAEPAMGLGE